MIYVIHRKWYKTHKYEISVTDFIALRAVDLYVVASKL
jgi:hypothetical protein